MSLFNRTYLEELASSFLSDNQIDCHESFYAEAFRYAKYLANSKLKPFKNYWIERTGEVPSLDCAVHAMEALIEYVESEKFPAEVFSVDPISKITRFLKNRISDHIRKEMKFHSVAQRSVTEDFQEDLVGNLDENDPVSEEIEKKMCCEAVTKALDKIPEDLREMFEYRFGLNLMPKEISRILKVPVGEVYQSIATLKKAVKENLVA